MSDIAVPVSETAPTHADEREPSTLHANLVERIRELVIEGDLISNFCFFIVFFIRKIFIIFCNIFNFVFNSKLFNEVFGDIK